VDVENLQGFQNANCSEGALGLRIHAVLVDGTIQAIMFLTHLQNPEIDPRNWNGSETIEKQSVSDIVNNDAPQVVDIVAVCREVRDEEVG
jgi:hypothetical protein